MTSRRNISFLVLEKIKVKKKTTKKIKKVSLVKSYGFDVGICKNHTGNTAPLKEYRGKHEYFTHVNYRGNRSCLFGFHFSFTI